VSIDASPPAQPPQMSPDGNWVWDGSQWQPVTGVEPAHQGVFAAYAQKVEAADQAVAASPPAAVAAPVQVAPPKVDYAYPAPAVDYSYPAESNEPIIPLWQQPKSSRKTVYLYAGGAFALFAMVLIILNSINFLSLPFFNTSSNPTPAAKPSPSPNPIRSEFGRADEFIKGSFTPALVTLEQSMPQIATCTGALSNSCFDGITAIDYGMKNLISVIDKGPVAPCIAAPVKKYRSDLATMEAGLQLALNGYKDSRVADGTNGVNQYKRLLPALPGDFAAIDKAENTQCSPDPEGP
jgi:hypothetical protein